MCRKELILTSCQPEKLYNEEVFRNEASRWLDLIRDCSTLDDAREKLFVKNTHHVFDTHKGQIDLPPGEVVKVRDCVRAFNSMLKERSEQRAGFSVAGVFWDIARGKHRPDLKPGFFAEMIYLIKGVEGRTEWRLGIKSIMSENIQGREAALVRSDELDEIWSHAQAYWTRYTHGLRGGAKARRERRRQHVLDALGGQDSDWKNWHWHIANVIKDVETLKTVVPLKDKWLDSVEKAVNGGVPFGITPYYASLIDDDAKGRDRSIRAQVIPPMSYVDEMISHKGDREYVFDFMLERDTSPIDLVTRRYPAITILKPYNSCPQICVYCQRNWEIDRVLAPNAAASQSSINEAVEWIRSHPSIREVLITGGDPLTMSDKMMSKVLDRVADIPSVDLIRIGSRTIVTIPMRITEKLADMLAGYRKPGKRDIAMITHVQHPYEITMPMVEAVDRLKRRGISIYNQMVYTFYVSRRFEAMRLRMLLRRIGIDPYYTFATKGKLETSDYRVPLARLMQEQKEESRMLPGLRRTDEVVYNVPGMGKNYIRALQNRDVLSVLPDGSRVYEFHPWEKNIVERDTYISADMPILDYLNRLEQIGENPDDYISIWYYY